MSTMRDRKDRGGPKANGQETLAEKLAGEIGQAILGGDFPPGMRLDEHMLAERFAVSRTPVREALRQVAATGLIEVRPRRGAIVTSITAEQLAELFVAMGEIEATCARLSALGMNPIERRRLESFHSEMAQMAEAGDEKAYADSNARFHQMIYAGAHNRVLLEMATNLRSRLDPFRRAQFRAPGRLMRSHQEHDAVVSAIMSGDGSAAHQRMLDHVNLVEDAFETLSRMAGARKPMQRQSA